jgi:hypothetical protein
MALENKPIVGAVWGACTALAVRGQELTASITWEKTIDTLYYGVIGAIGGLLVHLVWHIIKRKFFK